MKQGVLILAFVGLGLLALLFCTRPAYRQYKESRALDHAQMSLANAEYADASLSARQVLQLNPSNLEACKIMARLAEMARAPQLLQWRRHIAQLAPSLDNKLALASASVRLEPRPCPTAAAILNELEHSAGDCCTYHVISAELALKVNQPKIAEQHFIEASRLEPTNQLHQLNLAVLRLGSKRSKTEVQAKDSDVAEPRATLESLLTNSTYAMVALRSLRGDALRRKDLSAAERYSNQLLAQPQAAFQDQLQHLSLLRRQTNTQFEAFLDRAQKNATSSPGSVYALASWMTASDLSAAALVWLTNLPASTQSTMPVPLAIGDALVAQCDWPGLEARLSDQNWNELEFMRLGLLARAACRQNMTQTAQARWRLALGHTGNQLGPLLWLLAASEPSGQAPDPVLWRIVHQFPNELWAWERLEQFYSRAQDTSALNLVYSELAACRPQDFVAQNNFAATSLLLKRHLARAHAIARELHVQRPDDLIIASTYALSLHLQGRNEEGLATLQKCPADALETPPLALYYGVLLEANGQTNLAGRFLSLAQESALLPEERALVLEAANRAPRP